ncbi:MAG: UDP-N-acetylmuramoyl-tripeptide--D-alanyl-D-alanine ligase [Pseudomonadota bacterium]
MIQGQLAKLAQELNLELIGNDNSFKGISIDSRRLEKGNIFVAIRGERFDGHDFIEAASKKNPACIISEKPLTINYPYILCKNSRLLLGKMASWWRSKFHIPFLALTGTCGKTTTKQMLGEILKQSHQVLLSEKTFNNDLGVPLTLFRLGKEHQFAVLECGMNHPGEINYLGEIIQPQVAAVTNIGAGHIEFFKNLDAIAKEKSDLYRTLIADGIGIVNLDDRYSTYFQDVLHSNKIMTCSVQAKQPQVKAVDIELDELQRPGFRLLYQGKSVSVQLPLLGKHNIMNALIAASMALAVNVNLTDIKCGLEKTINMPQRMQLHTLNAETVLIDDGYNAIPDAVEKSLELLAGFAGKRIFIFGGMAELGDKAIRYHQKIGRVAKNLGIDAIYAFGEYCHFTIEAFGEGGKLFANQNQLIEQIKRLDISHACLLVKGSRGSKMENVVAAILPEK